ncbi:MAG: hypothetical protein WC285_01970 [Candidatus Gracilibacteria bacterium]|jgi:Zn ribbon nucleic-acid-binding protein
MEQKICKNCGQNYEITKEDQGFYKRIDVLPPALCPDCRSNKRLSIRNESSLYKRKCNFCDKGVISIYSADKSFPVYCQECFWGDKWDALKFGLDFGSDKRFFDQFQVLVDKTPRLAVVNKQSENSEYCNYSFANKNCYLTFGNHYEEDCLYGRYSTKNKDCLDYLWLYKSELCYECVFSKNCYRSVYLDHCEDCDQCYFSIDLKGCKDCIGCANLRHKQYYVFNQPYTREEYLKKIESLKLNTYDGFTKAKEFFASGFRKNFPFRAFYKTNCENCEGNNLENSKNLHGSFDCTACEDCAYGFQMDETYSSMDMNCMGYDRSEVCYQTIGCSGIFNCLVCDSCWHNNDLKYCQLCFSCKDCFGCISLSHKQYCILNKQYSKGEYGKLVLQIIENMKTSGEYGEFFPNSTFAYNETVAQEYFPLTREKAIAHGFQWREKDKKEYKKQEYEVSEDIKDVPASIIKEILACEFSLPDGQICGKNYKIVEAELKFYKKLNLPIPHLCPECRHNDRVSRRNPRHLWQRKCSKCGADVQTVYAPDRPETIYCEKCSLETVV